MANKNMNQKPYKARSLKNAQATVRQCRKQITECHKLLERWSHERKMLARLASATPQFSNPFDVIEAQKIRDSILKPLNDEPSESARTTDK